MVHGNTENGEGPAPPPYAPQGRGSFERLEGRARNRVQCYSRIAKPNTIIHCHRVRMPRLKQFREVANILGSAEPFLGTSRFTSTRASKHPAGRRVLAKLSGTSLRTQAVADQNRGCGVSAAKSCLAYPSRRGPPHTPERNRSVSASSPTWAF